MVDNSDSGYVLCGWSDMASKWLGIVHSDDRQKLMSIANTLIWFGLDLYIFKCPSLDDAAICEAMDRHRPPKTAFVAHWPDDPNAD